VAAPATLDASLTGDCAIGIFAQAAAQPEYAAPPQPNAALAALGIGRVAMVHYSPSTKRRADVTASLAVHGVDVTTWVLAFDRENITDSMRQCLHTRWDPDAYPPEKRARFPRPEDRKPLVPSQISVVTKHFFALYLAGMHTPTGHTLIIEDDVLLRAGFLAHLSNAIREADAASALPRSSSAPSADGASTDAARNNDDGRWGVLMIGGCLKMHATRRKFRSPRVGPHLFERGEARCAHAYVVTAAAARALLQSMPLTSAIDFQLNAAFREAQGRVRVFWTEPWLAVQGDYGDCVTKHFGGKQCYSVHKYERSFDVKFASDPAAVSTWNDTLSFQK
jgi:hypothetical protein